MTDLRIPREDDDYAPTAIEGRQRHVREHTDSPLEHVASYSLDPTTLPGNVEHFLGVAQVPIGVAGPLLVDGEHAQGEFLVPLATTEGTLVASYNRGMKLCREAGGIRTTVLDDRMQRAPVFSFESAREARDFAAWLEENFDSIAAAAEETTSSGKLLDIQRFSVSKLLYTRFNYSTGDAAGQNMTGKATFAACAWIKQNYPRELHFLLEGQFATDKKTSVVNMLHTRGKRVVAEITLPAALVEEQMHVSTDKLYAARMRGQLGSIMSVTNNNGNHSANGLTAMFIATGQDVANVAESSALYGFSELLPNGDFYASVTLPSLIIATYGGGTGLATQRECLEVLGCYGSGKVLKLAEIMAATVLAGELSLGSAVVAEEWVEAHDKHGRNRP
ncbi:hydroxymethylglutaryl-CoA reductase [Nocardioides marmoribigeumensis]|uniref:hydroxymethylglutaryl-CoA reductase (NADPH) n=1 Tax=Nocardioides marmoribigeumensis TaxID=433649 RepID=A0ABU2BR53_9ACTN|nr:hydroxymethylglutaryl-CoA reductase [Nocardioides marmoribigeumensis]MDR7360464.1 hydroxymethylglutaryl-CoA reductase (NADPH) [Nocardioides marmoribigeumensis]